MEMTTSFDTLLTEHVGHAARRAGYASGELPPTAPRASSPDSSAVVEDIGEYLVLTARTWSLLTESLVSGKHIDQSIREVHERSRMMTRLSDLSSIASTDVNLSKLMQGPHSALFFHKTLTLSQRQ